MLTPDELYEIATHLMGHSRKLEVQAGALHSDPEAAREMRELSRRAKDLSDRALIAAQAKPAAGSALKAAAMDSAGEVPAERNLDGAAL